MHLEAAQLEFLTRLGKSPDGQQLLKLIQAEIDDSNALLRTRNGDSLLREQGKAVYLDEIASRLRSQSVPALSKRVPTLIDEPA